MNWQNNFIQMLSNLLMIMCLSDALLHGHSTDARIQFSVQYDYVIKMHSCPISEYRHAVSTRGHAVSLFNY